MNGPLLSPFLTLCLLLVATVRLPGQTPRYVITFTDKNSSPYQLSNPGAYLSARALVRRSRQHISIDSTDLPVNPAYADSVLKTGAVRLVYTLRWLNGMVIETGDSNALEKIERMPFVKKLEKGAPRTTPPVGQPGHKFRPESEPAAPATLRTTGIDYGVAYTQIHLHQGEYLHNKGMRGEGMLIALLDEGFSAADQNRAFAWLRSHSKITATRDLTDGSPNVYHSGDHGSRCLAILAASLPGEMTGTAPEAAYILLRTEDNSAELPVEESNWAAAAELADSLGADLISSSLGYNTFDNPVYDHTYAQLNGRTTLIAQAASMATRKGLLVVSSVGNEGNTAWKYLLTPADTDSILSVGAVNQQGQVAAFSGFGPAADGRIKPEVAALGIGTALVLADGNVTGGNGTSYACPVIAGLAACLWQAFPRSTNQEILEVIKICSSQYATPDNRIGYGIPNFRAAYDTLLNREMRDTAYIREQLGNAPLKVFPNPFSQQLKLFYRATTSQPVQLQLIDAAGRITRNWRLAPSGNYGYFSWQQNVEGLPNGVYFLRLIQGKESHVVKVIRH